MTEEQAKSTKSMLTQDTDVTSTLTQDTDVTSTLTLAAPKPIINQSLKLFFKNMVRNFGPQLFVMNSGDSKLTEIQEARQKPFIFSSDWSKFSEDVNARIQKENAMMDEYLSRQK